MEDFITVNILPLAPNCAFQASETQIINGTSVDFIDLTENNPTNWIWLFEGGTPSFSSDQSPSGITYDNEGIFDVTLIVSNAAGSDTLTKIDYMQVGLNSIMNSTASVVNIYPNPTESKVTIDVVGYRGVVTTKVYDIIGNLIISTNQKTIDMQEYSNGIYLFKIEYDNRVDEFKVIRN